MTNYGNLAYVWTSSKAGVKAKENFHVLVVCVVDTVPLFSLFFSSFFDHLTDCFWCII